MGYSRLKPARLAEKLRSIRIALGLSQTEMHRRLEAEELITYTQISKYESGLREPPLQILLQYARVACVNLEVLADDELDLPETLPGPTHHEEIKRKFTSHRKTKR
jgi:transcriptional regulator with XRE-family HTH domain